MVDLNLLVGLSLAALINFSPTTSAVQCPETRATKNLISLNGFKEKEILNLVLGFVQCEKEGEDGVLSSDLILLSIYARFQKMYGELIKVDLSIVEITGDSKSCFVFVTVSDERPVDVDQSIMFHIWTDTKQIEPLRWEISSDQNDCNFEQVQEILRESFNTDPNYEMTLYDHTGQRITLENCRLAKNDDPES